MSRSHCRPFARWAWLGSTVACWAMLAACAAGPTASAAQGSEPAAAPTQPAQAPTTTATFLPLVTQPQASEGETPVPTHAPTATATADLLTQPQCYFDAVASEDLDALGECFTPDAEIIDVGRHIRGVDAIRTWADNEVLGGRYSILERTATGAQQVRMLVRFTPPGSSGGFRAYYTFDLAGGKITRADLQYA